MRSVFIVWKRSFLYDEKSSEHSIYSFAVLRAFLFNLFYIRDGSPPSLFHLFLMILQRIQLIISSMLCKQLLMRALLQDLSVG